MSFKEWLKDGLTYDPNDDIAKKASAGREKGSRYERQGAVYAMEQALNRPLGNGAVGNYKPKKQPEQKPPKASELAPRVSQPPVETDLEFLSRNLVTSPSNSYDAWRKRTYG